MKKETKIRYSITGVFFLVVLGLLVVRLFDLQFVHGEEHLTTADKFSQKKIRLTGPRGKILDSNGLPLAYNKTSYSVEFTRDPKLNEKPDRINYSKIILQTYRIIVKNGGKFLSTFAIRKLEDGSFNFYWADLDLNKAEDVKTFQSREAKWRENNCIGSSIPKDATPAELFAMSCDYYGVPADATYEEAFALLSVWQEVRSTRYASYIPVTLASDVNYETVAEVKMNRNELIGMQVEQSSTRVYPNKTMAAHIIGYMNRMLDEPTMKGFQDMGYSSDDLVGVTGIEKTQELELSGNTSERTGTKVIEVDNYGREIRTIESDNKSPQAGNNVMLTIDSNMQKRLEKALEENIAQVRANQETAYNAKRDYYDEQLTARESKSINYANVGAAVVMDVQTGDILAMASYPSYDLNLFTGGISTQDYKKLTENSDNPLFNNAVQSRGTPGSIFKMTTSLAGLMEGKISLSEKISCKYEYREHLSPDSAEVGPKCWDRNGAVDHANQTIIEALKNSCNYFFYTVADRVGDVGLTKWADLLGLTSKTGVELPDEVAGQIGNQQSLYSQGNMSGVAALVRNKVAGMLKTECTALGLKYEDDIYTEVTLQLMDLVNLNLKGMGPDIRVILKNELKLSAADIAKTNLDNEISLELTQIQWKRAFTIEDGVGQSVTLLTPVGVARYVSALVNGGNVYEARLVKMIIPPDGEARVNPPKLVRNLGVPAEYLNAIKEGMKQVVSLEEGGTAADAFADFPEEYKDMVGGKTGTAQVNKAIDLENNSWFVAFAPFDKPEIAVVVYIPHGSKGAYSAYTVKEMLKYYLDRKYAESEWQNMPAVNALVK
jgi:penicillin-binding protein 2